MTLDANSSVTVLQNGPCLTQKTPSVSTIEASHDANRSVTVAKGLSITPRLPPYYFELSIIDLKGHNHIG